MKRGISLILIFMMVLGINMTALVDAEEMIDIPVQISVKTLNEDGIEETYFAPGEHITFKYEITPQDIDANLLPNSKAVDIVLVCDSSGSMNESSGLTKDAWIESNYVYYNWDDFDFWISYNNIQRVDGDFQTWLYENAVLQNENQYTNWKQNNTLPVSFYRWRVEFVEEESDTEWENRLDLKEESFNEWKDNKFNNVEKDGKLYTYNGIEYTIKSLRNYWKPNFEEKYFYLDTENDGLYSGYYKENEFYVLKENVPKIYIYQGNNYTLDELEVIFDDNFSDYLLLTKEDNDFSNDEIVSLEKVRQYWVNYIENTYLFNDEYYSNLDLQTYYNIEINSNFIYRGLEYSYYELENIFDYLARYKYYDKNLNGNYTQSSSYKSQMEIDNLWNNLPEKTRIGAARKALSTFVDRMYESDMKNKISIALVDYDSFARVENQKNIVSDSVDSLKQNIAGLLASGGTNSGDGLRLASILLDDNSKDKYVVFMTDGLATGWTYNRDYNWYENLNMHYLYDYNSDRFDDETDNYYYQNNLINIKDVSENTLKYTPEYTFDDYKVKVSSNYDEYANYYLQTIAKNLIANNNITTYVVGVGDGSNAVQKLQNESLARNANYGLNSGDISNLYYPVNDASKLESLYDTIAKDIISNIPIDNMKIELPFISSQQMTMSQNIADDVIVKSIKVNGEEVINNNSHDDSFFDLSGNNMSGKLPEFSYSLNEESGLFEAEPMILEIKVKLPESMDNGNFGIGNTGLVSYDVAYGESTESQSAVPSGVMVSVMKGLKPVGITATYDIVRDGYDGSINTSMLEITPQAEYNGLEIVYGPNDEYKIDVKTYNADQKYNIDTLMVDLSDYHLDILSKGSTFKVKTYNRVYLADEGTYVDRIGEEEISILNLNPPVYVGENSSSDIMRNINLSFNGPENLNAVKYGLLQPTTEFTPIVSGSNYQYPNDLMLNKGINSLIFEAENRYGNRTVLQTNTFIHARRPRIEADSLTDDSAIFNIYTFDEAVVADYSVIFKDADNNETILPVSIDGDSGVYSLQADISNVEFIENTSLKIVIKDNYANIGILGDQNDPDDGDDDDDDDDEDIEDEVNPGSFVSLIKIGLYDTLHSEFFDDIYMRNNHVVLGMRYTYGVKFRYGDQDTISIDFNNVDLKAINAKIVGSNVALNISDNYGNIIVSDLKDNFVVGQEYTLIVNLTFNSNADHEFITTATVGMGVGHTLDKTATIKITPNIE